MHEFTDEGAFHIKTYELLTELDIFLSLFKELTISQVNKEMVKLKKVVLIRRIQTDSKHLLQ